MSHVCGEGRSEGRFCVLQGVFWFFAVLCVLVVGVFPSAEEEPLVESFGLFGEVFELVLADGGPVVVDLADRECCNYFLILSHSMCFLLY